MAELTEAGCVGFSQADATIVNTLTLQRALLYAATYGYTVWLRPQDAWLGGGVAASGAVATRLGLSGVPVAAETIALHTLFELVRGTGARLHLCRLSSAAGVELLRQAKAEGLPVTADVSINSLHLTDVDVGFFNAAMRVTPPLRQQRDRDALQAALVDGTLDALVSDHSPVSSDEKTLPFGEATPGATGLELLLGLALSWGQQHRLTLAQTLARITSEPVRVLGAAIGSLGSSAGRLVVGGVADVCIFDPEVRWAVRADALVSQGKHTPFAFDISGFELAGRVQTTLGGRRPGVRAQRRVMRAARAAWRLLLMLVHLVHGMAVVVSRFPSLDAAGRQARVQWWSAKLLRRLGITLTVQGTPRGGPTLLVANHVSWLDAAAIHAAAPQTRFVAKADVSRWPLVGRLLAGAGTLFIERDKQARRIARRAPGGRCAARGRHGGGVSRGHDRRGSRAAALSRQPAAGRDRDRNPDPTGGAALSPARPGVQPGGRIRRPDDAAANHVAHGLRQRAAGRGAVARRPAHRACRPPRAGRAPARAHRRGAGRRGLSLTPSCPAPPRRRRPWPRPRGRRGSSGATASARRRVRTTSGMPFGMFRPTISASPMSSRYFTSARIELPCAATTMRWPARRAGARVSFQHGSTRATVSFRHSVSGTWPGASLA